MVLSPLTGARASALALADIVGPTAQKERALKERHSGTRLLPIALLTVMVSNALVLVHVTRRLASVCHSSGEGDDGYKLYVGAFRKQPFW